MNVKKESENNVLIVLLNNFRIIKSNQISFLISKLNTIQIHIQAVIIQILKMKLKI